MSLSKSVQVVLLSSLILLLVVQFKPILLSADSPSSSLLGGLWSVFFVVVVCHKPRLKRLCARMTELVLRLVRDGRTKCQGCQCLADAQPLVSKYLAITQPVLNRFLAVSQSLLSCCLAIHKLLLSCCIAVAQPSLGRRLAVAQLLLSQCLAVTWPLLSQQSEELRVKFYKKVSVVIFHLPIIRALGLKSLYSYFLSSSFSNFDQVPPLSTPLAFQQLVN